MTYVLADIAFGDLGWLPLALLVAVAAGLAVLWAYRRTAHAGSARILAACLKASGLLALAVCLVEPLWSGMRARPGANLFFVLADNSRSMQVRDVDGGATASFMSSLTGSNAKRTRAEYVEALLKTREGTQKNAAWQHVLGQDFDVRTFSFDAGLRQIDEPSDLDFSGDGSSLKRHLTTISETYKERPIGGVLLVTDGNATDLLESELDTAGWPKIYPLVVGTEKLERDIAIESVGISQTNFEDAPVTIQADVSSRGFQGRKVIGRLIDEKSQVVETSIMTVQDEEKPLVYRFKIRPTALGVSFYRLQVADEDDIEQLDDEKKAENIREATLANNQRLIDVDRGAQAHRILYVSGRPNWEYKFLRRAIEDDEQIDLVGMIRVAKREAKFDFRGRDGESKNSIFRGFENQNDETAESYDEPVIVRMNTKSASELRDGFPKSEKELYGFEAIVLDDIEAKFFTHDQLALIERFVSERGGGLLMLGGQESFQRGGYYRTPIGDLLPVYLDRDKAASSPPRIRMKLTRYGWLQPWVRLRSTEDDERSRISSMPEFHTLNRLSNIKPGAWILASAEDSSNKTYPALIAQRYGRGRAAALAIGDFWRWHLRRDEEENDDQGKAWRQTLRWLVADVPKPIEVDIEKDDENSEKAVRFKVSLRNDDYQPLENATVKVRIKRPQTLKPDVTNEQESAGKQPAEEQESDQITSTPDLVPVTSVVTANALTDTEDKASNELEEQESNTLELRLEPSLKEPGTYEVVYVPREPGAYRATVDVVDSEGQPLGTADAGWTSDPGAEEFRSVSANYRLMQAIAKKTGGRIVKPAELPQFVAGLATEEMPVSEMWTFPLWDHPAIFAFVLACLIAEWGLRRWKGLP
ncbi:MAG: hypothetical protein CMJ78_07780 [Planctomycetaceae bacterium]|nr:hypothetical protein [Planctomycetaceae bacterium]